MGGDLIIFTQRQRLQGSMAIIAKKFFKKGLERGYEGIIGKRIFKELLGKLRNFTAGGKEI